jgi:hypothetical protein
MESWWLEVTNLKVAQIGLILGLTWKGGKRHDRPSCRFIGQVGVPRYCASYHSQICWQEHSGTSKKGLFNRS